MNNIKHTAGFEIDQPATVLFPLFSAEGEKSWVPGWDYKNLMGSTDLHEDYIFITANHDHAASDAIWLVKRYQPEIYRIEFYKVEPGEKVGIVKVKCAEVSEYRTEVEVSYEYIALSEKGENFIETFTDRVYKEFIDEWRILLEAYFKRQH